MNEKEEIMNTTDNNKETKLTIKTVATLSGISAHTLRAWERRYSALNPKRSESGHRYYSYADIDRLKTIKKLISLGHSVGTIAHLPDAELEQILQKSISVKAEVNAAEPQRAPEQKFLNPEPRLELNATVLPMDKKQLRRTFSEAEMSGQFVAPLLGKIRALVDKQVLTHEQENIIFTLVHDHLKQFQAIIGRQDQQKPYSA